ncbi:MAG TPA: isocitrate lyase/phosphoenolpyruvate mutase family protein [Sporichthyaceae bacterium]|nr:isocitrate lyase/phosphoenolpyruvate mutase family protein [Sporichthyaceae bacterium]
MTFDLTPKHVAGDGRSYVRPALYAGSTAPISTVAAANIARVLSVPLTIDLEDGYAADARVVAGHVARLVQVGIAGINIEDGADEPAVLAAKVEAIRAAVSTSGADVFVNVRTDVYLRGLAPEGVRVSEVLARAKLYRDAGADGLFVPGIWQPEEIGEVAAAAGLPLNVMYLPGLPALAELGALGVRRLSAGTAIAQGIWGAARVAAEAFLDSGTLPAGPAMDYGEIQQLLSQGG